MGFDLDSADAFKYGESAVWKLFEKSTILRGRAARPDAMTGVMAGGLTLAALKLK